MPIKYKIRFNIIGWLIIISTQFVKQHVIMDLLAGLVLVEGVYKGIEYIFYNTNFIKRFDKKKKDINNIEIFK